MTKSLGEIDRERPARRLEVGEQPAIVIDDRMVRLRIAHRLALAGEAIALVVVVGGSPRDVDFHMVFEVRHERHPVT